MTATGSAAFTTTVRVVNRVHNHTTDLRTASQPAGATGLAQVDVGMIGVADFTNGGAATSIHVADFARRHPQLSKTTLFGDQLDRNASGAGNLGPAARTHLYSVNRGTQRNVP